MKIFILIITVASSSCWQFVPSLVDLDLKITDPAPEYESKSEYFYGDCNNDEKVFYAHEYINSTVIAGKLLLRGWLNVTSIPTCVILRAVGDNEMELYKATAYSFQFCTPRVTYLHSQRRYNYYYYEWFIPYDTASDMNWDIYFYGTGKADWTIL